MLVNVAALRVVGDCGCGCGLLEALGDGDAANRRWRDAEAGGGEKNVSVAVRRLSSEEERRPMRDSILVPNSIYGAADATGMVLMLHLLCCSYCYCCCSQCRSCFCYYCHCCSTR